MVKNGDVIVITGASSGIGREMAYQLAPREMRLVLAARDVERLEEVAAACREKGAKTLVVQTDVSEKKQCSRLVAQAVNTYGSIDVLVNNAGFSMRSRFDKLDTLDRMEQMMQVNFMGSMYCTYFAIPHLKRSSGRIVAVSSLAGINGVPGLSVYSGTKHAMAGFFDSLRIELKEFGISVTNVYPGMVATEVGIRAIGPNGEPVGKSPLHEPGKAMSVEHCVKMMIRAMDRRERKVVMTLKGKASQWMRLLIPGLVDKLAADAVDDNMAV